MDDEPTQKGLAAEAEKLERALADLEARKRAAAELAAENAPELERLKALQARLDALPQSERREVLDAMGLHRVSAAPKPLEPERSSAYVRRPPPVLHPPRWPVWRALPYIELWQAVALSLSIEPEDALKAEACREAETNVGVRGSLPKTFFERRQDCMRGLSTDGPIRPQGPLYPGALTNFRCQVLLGEVTEFLTLAGYELPQELRPIPTEDAPARAESTVERQDRRLRECVAAGLTMPNAPEGRLPDGVGDMAKAEGVTRQFYCDDLKAALRRDQKRRRAGGAS